MSKVPPPVSIPQPPAPPPATSFVSSTIGLIKENGMDQYSPAIDLPKINGFPDMDGTSMVGRGTETILPESQSSRQQAQPRTGRQIIWTLEQSRTHAIQSGGNRRNPNSPRRWPTLHSPIGAYGDSPGWSAAQPWVTDSPKTSSPEGAIESDDLILRNVCRIAPELPTELTNILIVCLASPVGKGHETHVLSTAVDGRKNRLFLYSD